LENTRCKSYVKDNGLMQCCNYKNKAVLLHVMVEHGGKGGTAPILS
jgi:hypothetical protein